MQVTHLLLLSYAILQESSQIERISKALELREKKIDTRVSRTFNLSTSSWDKDTKICKPEPEKDIVNANKNVGRSSKQKTNVWDQSCVFSNSCGQISPKNLSLSTRDETCRGFNCDNRFNPLAALESTFKSNKSLLRIINGQVYSIPNSQIPNIEMQKRLITRLLNSNMNNVSYVYNKMKNIYNRTSNRVIHSMDDHFRVSSLVPSECARNNDENQNSTRIKNESDITN